MTKFRNILQTLFCSCLLASATGAFAAIPWFPFGPDGGDARALAGDPLDHNHVYMGTGNGWVYESHDGGRAWKRLARIGQRDDFMVDNIEVGGPGGKRIVVGVYVTNKPDGGVYVSKDGGHTWLESQQLHGHSVRALASAPSNHNILVAGALDGVYRSDDGGEQWTLISPKGSTEIHEIESLAIDPKDPDTIYAGTWHLPWKTTDGGKNWVNIKEGIIDDSDVFSIIIDPKNPKIVYASACSGIYKSESAGEPNSKLPNNNRFTKVQGIPATARRTRVLMQDPTRAQIVFAGTTEGLFRTSDAGKTWVRNTTPDTIINDVFVDPAEPDHVLLATDRQGVIRSDDGGFTFHAANKGFSSRQISSFASSHSQAGNIAVGVVNDKAYGGVFVSGDGGLTWMQRSEGLDGRDVFSLMRTADDTLLAGTSHGIFRFTGSSWVKSGLLLSPVRTATVTKVVKGKRIRVSAPQSALPAASHFDGVVYALAASGNTVYAAAGDNLVMSLTAGEGWQVIPAMKGKELRYLSVLGGRVLVGGLRMISMSADAGKTWKEIKLPGEISLLTALSMDDTGRIWAGGREGVVVSENGGASWSQVDRLQVTDLNNLYFDGRNHRMLVTVNRPTFAAEVNTSTMKVSYMDTGWNLRFMRPVGDHLLGATLFDGVVLQPKMMETELSTVYKAAQ